MAVMDMNGDKKMSIGNEENTVGGHLNIKRCLGGFERIGSDDLEEL